MIRIPTLLAIATLTLFGCGSSSDDGTADAGGERCEGAADCDDGLFCNGVEVCAADGCVAGTNPCPDGIVCDEESDTCPGACDDPDRDGDGIDAIACGGTDCDDDDADRYPGNTEICDDGHDEDCDDTTLGLDRDSDGFIDAMCCNGDTCGDDCDDTRLGISPGASEVCNELDDDCDGSIDEEVTRLFYRDVDGDGFGTDSETFIACSAPAGFALSDTDCDDTQGEVNPAAVEVCDAAAAIDENCDGSINEDCECTGDESRACPGAMGACSAGEQVCVSGAYSACTVQPRDEICGDGIDNDCDGTTADEREVATGSETLDANVCAALDLSPGDNCSMTVAGSLSTVQLSNFTMSSGGGWYAVPITMGFGPVTFSLNIGLTVVDGPDLDLRGGWAMLLADDPPGPLTGVLNTDVGVPTLRQGIALEWRYTQGFPVYSDVDALTIRRLTGSGSGNVLATCELAPEYRLDDGGESLTADVDLRYVPANPLTGSRPELEVLVGGVVACSTSASGLPDWSAGQDLYVGATGSRGGSSRTAIVTWRSASNAAVVAEGVCP